MTAERSLRVLFRVAAGPRIGFGHLVRARSLARALGVPAAVSLRGAPAAPSLSVDWQPVIGRATTALDTCAPDVLVVDDPVAAEAAAWIRPARRAGIPVAAVHDLGLGYVESDLGIDGSIRPRSDMRGRLGDLRGPSYAILDPQLLAWLGSTGPPAPPRVLVALGGGVHVRRMAQSVAGAIAGRLPDANIRVASGFVSDSPGPALPAGEWVHAPNGLGAELAAATLAIVGGGVTLYEACALGTPAIGVAVTSAQHETIRAFAERDAALDAGLAGDADVADRIAGLAARVASCASVRERLRSSGRHLIDGRGAFRVADALRQLVSTERVSHVA